MSIIKTKIYKIAERPWISVWADDERRQVLINEYGERENAYYLVHADRVADFLVKFHKNDFAFGTQKTAWARGLTSLEFRALNVELAHRDEI